MKQTENAVHNAPLHAIVTRLVNDAGETYFLKIGVDDPSGFVRGLWESIDKYASAHDDDYFVGELTDRMRDFRTTVSRSMMAGHEWEVCIRTHAWHPQGDKRELHGDVLAYLRGAGVAA